jgi:sortase (surface protein transpeptidase)
MVTRAIRQLLIWSMVALLAACGTASHESSAALLEGTAAPTITAPTPTPQPRPADESSPAATAPPPATPEPAPSVAVQPVALAPVERLIIPALGIDVAPVDVGLDEQRVPIVPRHDVGWYSASAVPRQGSNVVFWGHVLRWQDSPAIPAPFERVHELERGAEIVVITADQQEHRYRVSQQIEVRPDTVAYIQPTPGERVTLVSCIGDNVIVNGTLTKELRLVTIALPVR